MHDGAIACEHKCKHILYATILEKEKVRLFGIIEDIKKVGHVRKVEHEMEIQDFLVKREAWRKWTQGCLWKATKNLNQFIEDGC